MSYNPFADQTIYIAGPACFYERGYDLWWSQRKLAEYYGFNVSIPTSTPLRLDAEDLRKNAHEIFDDLIVQAHRSTAIIADLEFFRGCEPDGGTLFEMGWIHSLGGTLYGFTRDLRTMGFKNQGLHIEDGKVLDQHGEDSPYQELPFCPTIMATTKLVEGSFETCLKTMVSDLNEKRRLSFIRKTATEPEAKREKKEGGKPRVFLSGPFRYRKDGKVVYEALKAKYQDSLELVSPFDFVVDEETKASPDPYALAVARTEFNLKAIDSADYFVADLSNYHGLEPNSDTSFECGYAYGKGKKLLGCMDDARKMRERIPNLGEEKGYTDLNGMNVENFNYPINLMFACSMPIIQGDLESGLKSIL